MPPTPKIRISSKAKPTVSKRNLYIVSSLGIATFATMAVTLWMIFSWVPTDINQGAVQRIFYFHVPLAWVSMVAIIIVAIASIVFLIRGKALADSIAHSAAEVGVVFGGLMLISGIIWARPVWGQWWTGEAKLTTALVLFLVYIAYLIFRAYLPANKTKARLSAVIAIIGALMTPIIYFASELWQQAHPTAVIGPIATEESSLAPEIYSTLLVATLAMTLLSILITYLRVISHRSEDSLKSLNRQLELNSVKPDPLQTS